MRLRTYIGFIALALGGCQEDPEIIVNGVQFSMVDLSVNGRTTFSYQQALAACPEGWSLATFEDWQALLDRFGGYNNAGEIVGDPHKSFVALTGDGFNARKTWYWTDTPAWEDAPFIRSYTVLFDSMKQEAGKGALLTGAQLPCRCVKRPKPVTEDFFSFSDPKGSVQFDFYSFHVPNTQLLTVYLHRVLEGTRTLDRINFSLELPNEFVSAGEDPVEAQAAYATRHFNDTDSMFGANSYDFHVGPYDGSMVKFLITFYDGQVVKGTFSGHTWEGIPIQDGNFSIQVE